MDLRSAEDRCRNDPVFASLVQNMENAIERLELTPTEIRAAAMFAALRVEMRTPFAKPFLREIEEKIRKEEQMVRTMLYGRINDT